MERSDFIREERHVVPSEVLGRREKMSGRSEAVARLDARARARARETRREDARERRSVPARRIARGRATMARPVRHGVNERAKMCGARSRAVRARGGNE
tara:strand:+ start:17996 stop:18292 length:297 start_codon:yes stop_codon:yes gene_type:complete